MLPYSFIYMSKVLNFPSTFESFLVKAKIRIKARIIIHTKNVHGNTHCCLLLINHIPECILSTYLPIYLPAYSAYYLPARLPTYLLAHLPVPTYLPTYLPDCLPSRPPACLPACPPNLKTDMHWGKHNLLSESSQLLYIFSSFSSSVHNGRTPRRTSFLHSVPDHKCDMNI